MTKTAGFADNGTSQLARRYARIMAALYGQKKIRGKVARATRGARHLSLGVRLADPLALDAALSLAEPLALACRCHAVISQRSEADPGLVSYQFELAERYWQAYTRGDLTGLGVGFGEGRRQIDFGFSPPHSGVFGTTDSGKTETIRSILVGLVTHHEPRELGVLILDLHKDYEDLENVAHLVGPIAHDRQAAGDVLAWVSQELARRRAANERDGRRLVVAIDEAKTALADERALAIAVEVAREARKYRINLLVGSQEAKEATLPELVPLLNNRWVGLVADAKKSAQLTGQAGLDCHKLTGHGDFMHVAGAIVERLQVALATEDDLGQLPRVLVVPSLDVDPVDTPAVFNMEEQRGPGRPALEVEARHVAAYLHYGAENISIKAARDQLGLTRGQHDLHKGFTLEVERGLAWLKENESEVMQGG